MLISELFERFFEPKKALVPYRNEEEYLTDQLSYLDICLNLVCAAAGFNWEEQDIHDERYKGFIFMPADASGALLSNSLAEREKRLGEEAMSQLRRAEAHIRLREKISREEDFVPALSRMSLLFGLTELERFALLAAFSAAQDRRYEAIYAMLCGGTTAVCPTRGLLTKIYRFLFGLPYDEEGRFLSGEGNLHRFLLKPSGGGKTPAAEPVMLRPRAVSYCKGYNCFDSALSVYARPQICSGEAEPLLFRETLYRRIADAFAVYAAGNCRSVINLYGAAGIGKTFFLRMAAGECKKNLIMIDTVRLKGCPAETLPGILDSLFTETRLMNAVPCFLNMSNEDEDADDADEENKPSAAGELQYRMIHEYAERYFRFCIWITREKEQELSCGRAELVCIEMPMLTIGEKLLFWQEFTKEYVLEDDVSLSVLANQYILTPKGILDVLRTAKRLSGLDGRTALSREDIISSVRQHTVNQLGRYATLINAVFTWDDLVIGEDQKRQMQMICDRVRYQNVVGEAWGFHKKTPYGRGLCALFYGSPGTGKTMAVQVIANELGLDLYRIDLSQMTSKYIGETQKNISRLFKKAKNINAILFFDEADSMFSKRSQEVKDANDRYANADTAHLLQKFEEYGGITVLATNYVNNIDDAFKRRIKFMVNFVFPTAQVRLRLWKSVVPAGAVFEEPVDFEFFAEKFELSGSNIKEILTNAAYFAAAEHTGIANRHIILAIRLNFEKYGKSLTQSDFGYLGER